VTGTIGVHPGLHSATRVLLLLELGKAVSGSATNSELGAALGMNPDVVGRHMRVLWEAGLIMSGLRGARGYPWSLTETGSAQRALLLAQAVGAL
jgi:DNA-binding transcriptional ArsR family regulator